eukprot:3053929-Pleurochrysis_carterae.AAC.1
MHVGTCGLATAQSCLAPTACYAARLALNSCPNAPEGKSYRSGPSHREATSRSPPSGYAIHYSYAMLYSQKCERDAMLRSEPEASMKWSGKLQTSDSKWDGDTAWASTPPTPPICQVMLTPLCKEEVVEIAL